MGYRHRSMNIFYLHKDPVESAKLHCDKHVCKMIIEYAQMLSTAHRMLDGTEWVDSSSGRRIKRWKHPNSNMDGMLYKASHINHPSAIWVRENAIQYQYMYDMFIALCDEYTYRYGKKHSCYSTITHCTHIFPLQVSEPTTFTRAMPDEYKYDDTIDTFTAYKRYISSKPWASSNYLRKPDRKPDWIL